MPNIKIREQEAVQLAAFDITENTVLVPMLYARSYDTTSEGDVVYSVTPESKLFTSADYFRV